MMKWDRDSGFRRVWLRLTAVLGLIAVENVLEIFVHPKPLFPFDAIALCIVASSLIGGRRMIKQSKSQAEQLEHLLFVHIGLMVVFGLGTLGWFIDVLSYAIK